MRFSVGILTAALILGTALPSVNGAQEFQVVVNPSVRGSWISRASLSALFTGKTDRWGDNTPAKPVDQSSKAAVRRAFTSAVLGLSIGEMQQYWQARIAANRVFPPPIKGSDQEVLGFVAVTAGAVGYVAADANIPEGVKVISITE